MSEENPHFERFVLPTRPVALELPVPLSEWPGATGGNTSRTPIPPFTPEGGPLRRFSPRKSWPEVAAIDAKLDQLDRQRMETGARIGQLERAVADAQLADKTAVAGWQMDGGKGQRPLASAPALEAELEQARADMDSFAIAEDRILRQKVELVERHRKRLAKDAAGARKHAVAGLLEAIRHVERAREEVVDALRSERWAREFPGEDANAGSLRLEFMRGGRLSKAVPDVRTLTVATSVLEWLRDDAKWLDAVLADEEERELDPHEQAI